MLRGVLFVALAATAVFAMQERVCFPDIFSTETIAFMPQQEDAWGSKIFFTKPGKKQRVDVNVIAHDDQIIKEKYQMLFDYTKEVFYEIKTNISTHTSVCTKHQLHNHIENPCLAKNARRRGREVIGGTLEVDNFREHVEDHRGKVKVDVQVAAHINVPIRVFARTKAGMFIDEYQNWESHIPSESFVVPQVCLNAELSSEPKRTAKEVMHKLVPSSPMWW